MSEALGRIKAAMKPILGEYVSPAKLDAAARAAVDALREPTEAMDLAGVEAESYRSLGLLKVRHVWKVMIDAALSPHLRELDRISREAIAKGCTSYWRTTD